VRQSNILSGRIAMASDVPFDPGGWILDGPRRVAFHCVDGEVSDHASDMNEFVMGIPVDVIISIDEFEDSVRTR
jgi:hypothetical protein